LLEIDIVVSPFLITKKTPPLAAKRNGGAGTEKRPKHLSSMIPSFLGLSIVARQIFSDAAAITPPAR